MYNMTNLFLKNLLSLLGTQHLTKSSLPFLKPKVTSKCFSPVYGTFTEKWTYSRVTLIKNIFFIKSIHPSDYWRLVWKCCTYTILGFVFHENHACYRVLLYWTFPPPNKKVCWIISEEMLCGNHSHFLTTGVVIFKINYVQTFAQARYSTVAPLGPKICLTRNTHCFLP
jgi:hypothetical protein